MMNNCMGFEAMVDATVAAAGLVRGAEALQAG
jgi:hypothetical protein